MSLKQSLATYYLSQHFMEIDSDLDSDSDQKDSDMQLPPNIPAGDSAELQKGLDDQYNKLLNDRYEYILNNIECSKSFYDLDFNLFKSSLSRIQVICSCRSGAQFASVCAHCSALLWMVYFPVFDKEGIKAFDTILELRKDDQSRFKNIPNLRPWKLWAKEISKDGFDRHYHCPCGDYKANETELICCDSCDNWYHPSCATGRAVGINDNVCQTTQIHPKLRKYWHCIGCTGYEAFVVRESRQRILRWGLDGHGQSVYPFLNYD